MIYKIKKETKLFEDEVMFRQFSFELFSEGFETNDSSLTRHNAFIYKDGNHTVKNTNTDPDTFIHRFKKAYYKSKLNEQQLQTTKYELYYAFVKKDILYTNLYSNGSDGQLKRNWDRETIQEIAKNSEGSSPAKIEKEIEELTMGVKKVKDFNDVKPYIKDAITQEYIKRFFNNRTLIAMTHVDDKEDCIYHVHTVETRK